MNALNESMISKSNLKPSFCTSFTLPAFRRLCDLVRFPFHMSALLKFFLRIYSPAQYLYLSLRHV